MEDKLYVNILTGLGHAYYSGSEFIEEFDERDITKEAIQFGCQALREAAKQDVDVLFVDEFGKLERKQIGFYQTLRDILPKRKKPVVMIIRKSHVSFIDEMFDVPLTRVWDVNEAATIDDVVREMTAEIKNILLVNPRLLAEH